MRAEALTPADIFGYHVRYVVPLFQRPYVWNQQDQWEPLWDDVRAVAERLMQLRPLSPVVAPHFLGAIVVEQAPTLVGSIQVYHVIDGQQRLTTLQLLLDAAGRVTEEYGDAEDARRLRQLVFNDPAVRRDDEAYKVWPTVGDRDAYLAAMTGKPAPAELAANPVTEAHAFFVEAITAWAHEADLTDSLAPDATAVRLRALARAIGGCLRAVVIHLDPGDNAQGIFETLNHRGAPLLAADLIKNLVFRVAQAEGFDVVPLYQKYWADLDGPYWRAYVKRGRQVVPRIDVFVNYWLVMRLVREIRSDQTFASFRDHLNSAGPRIEELLRELASDARIYEAIGAASSGSHQPHPSESVPDLFCYRVFGALDAGAVTPFYLWLMRWPSSRLPFEQRDRALAAMESWVVRRWLCALSTKDNSNVVLDLVQALDAAGPQQAGDVTEAFLFGQRSNSRLWPPDDMVRKALKTVPLDPRVVRPRLRMLIEAIEDKRRTSEGAACERNLTIEHVMPLGWRSHWAPGVDAATAVLRDTLIHTLGNLTLVRWKLDAALANLPWTDAEAVAEGLGPTGKRTELANHSRLKINADLVAAHPDAWTEQTIAARTADLADVVVQVWPKPTQTPAPVLVPVARVAGESVDSLRTRSIGDTFGGVASDGEGPDVRGPDGEGVWGDSLDGLDGLDGQGLDRQGLDRQGLDRQGLDPQGLGDDGSDESPDGDGWGGEGSGWKVPDDGMAGDAVAGLDPAEVAAASRYARLTQFLVAQTADTIPLTFQQVEDIMEDPLPPAARTSIPFWSSTNAALGRAIVAGGFKPTNVDLWNERVIFARDAQARRPRRPRQHPRRRSSGRQAGLDR
ncbi:MAG: hypothetical protein QOE61_2188 [Micromonosporaceae bacterium]|nr:hypothetical protein [Micromonosporaceae bacterium]